MRIYRLYRKGSRLHLGGHCCTKGLLRSILHDRIFFKRNLKEVNLNMDITQLKTIQQNFVRELQEASRGKKTSLPFIVHELYPNPIVKDGETFQSFVIGGTVAKVATLKKSGSETQVLDKKEQQLSFRTEKDFLAFVNRMLPDNIDVLALNFAYPIQPVFENGKLDGVLLAVSKEGGFHGLVGKKIGKEVEDYVMAKRNKRVRVAVANDTVCLLTSGLSEFKEDELAAGIVGTGLNFAFFLGKNRLVNLESANFDKFPKSSEGKIIDQGSAKPGAALFEKETAGAYLYKHFNIVIREKGVNYPKLSSTEDLNKISLKNIPQVSEIAQSLLKRSAQLVACQIVGITEFMARNMVFNMEGSLFWKGNKCKETVAETVKLLVSKHKVKFVEIENSAILGAAKLVS